jgi:hypothetical protein
MQHREHEFKRDAVRGSPKKPARATDQASHKATGRRDYRQPAHIGKQFEEEFQRNHRHRGEDDGQRTARQPCCG